MKKLYKEQKNSIYKIGKETGLNLEGLYKYAKGKSHPKNMKASNVLKIAYLEKIEPNILMKKMIDYWNENFKENK